MDKVYLVEQRYYEEKVMTSIVAFVSSTLEKAVDFIEENKDYDEGDKWWWAVHPSIVDSEESTDELYYYNRKAERIYWQPSPNEKPFEIGETYNFDLDTGTFTYLNNYMFEGKLVCTEGELLKFENVKLLKEEVLTRTFEDYAVQLEDTHGLYRL